MDAPVNDTVSRPDDLARLALEATAEGIFGVDTLGRITFANASACRLLGYTAAEMVGQSARVLLQERQCGR
jgi:PAS domain S-box-containing protein